MDTLGTNSFAAWSFGSNALAGTASSGAVVSPSSARVVAVGVFLPGNTAGVAYLGGEAGSALYHPGIEEVEVVS